MIFVERKCWILIFYHPVNLSASLFYEPRHGLFLENLQKNLTMTVLNSFMTEWFLYDKHWFVYDKELRHETVTNTC